MPHDVASDLGLHCLPMSFHRFSGKNGLRIFAVIMTPQTSYFFPLMALFGKGGKKEK